VIVYDIAKIGAEIKAEDERDGPAEIMFLHGGHQSKVNDISWNSSKPFLMASVEEETNVL
jgi:histone-binding protein RBBP4